MSEAQNYAGKIVVAGPPERSANGQSWKKSLVEVQQEGSQYTKKFRVWPYDQGSDDHSPAYAAALANQGQDVTISFTEGGYQGQNGWVKQNDIIAISGPNTTQVTHSVEAGASWGSEPAATNPPPTDGALSVAEGAVLDAQQALTTALNAIRATAGATF